MYNLAPILVSNFPLLLLPTGSPLMKLWQFWPFQSPPDHPKCYLTAKSSPQPSIHIFRKSKKKLATFPIDFFRGIAKVWEGGHFTPPSRISMGPGGIHWQETHSDTHLEHPEKVPFLTVRGRKRVKEWRYTTFMKEWMKALDKTRILSPATGAPAFFVFEIWPFEVDFPARSNST